MVQPADRETTRRKVIQGTGLAAVSGLVGVSGCQSSQSGGGSNQSGGGDTSQSGGGDTSQSGGGDTSQSGGGDTSQSSNGSSNQSSGGGSNQFSDFRVGGPDAGIKAADIPYMWAIQKKLPEAYGYAGSVKQFEGANLTGQAFASGGIKMAFINPGVVANLKDSGRDVQIFGTEYAGTDYVGVINTTKASSIKEFPNSNVGWGMSGPGGNSQLQPAVMFRDKGYDLDNINFVKIGGSATRTKAVAAGRIGGVVIHYDQWLSIKDEKNVKKIGNMRDIIGGWIGESLFAKTKWLEQNPEWAINQLEFTIKGFRKARNDFEWYNKFFQQYFKEDYTKKEVRDLWEFNNNVANTWNRKNMKKETYKKFIDTVVELGQLPEDFSIDSIWTKDYYNQALDRVGEPPSTSGNSNSTTMTNSSNTTS